MSPRSRRRGLRAHSLQSLERRQLLAADVLINEIMYSPGEGGTEYLELLNAGDEATDLSGWRLTGGIQYTFDSYVLDPGQLLVVPADAAALAAAYPTLENIAPGWGDQRLHDDGEPLVLLDEHSATVDQVAYARQGDWAVRVPGPDDLGHQGWNWSADHYATGRSAELVNAALSNDTGQNWLASQSVGGTPGAANSMSSAGTAALILDVLHDPAIPDSTTDVNVTARLVGTVSDVSTPTLHWRMDGAADFAVIAMADDGSHGDGQAADGVFGATIPARADGTVVEYYIETTGESGQSRRWPAAAESTDRPATPAMFQVDDSSASALEFSPGDLPIYHVVMIDAARSELTDIGMDVGGASQSRAMMNATLIVVDGVETTIRHNVGIGNQPGDDAASQPSSYRVEIPADRDWDGTVAFDLSSQYPHVQHAGMLLYQQAGVSGPDFRPARVLINGDSTAPSHLHVERIDARSLAGNVYFLRPGSDPESPLSYLGPDADAYREQYEKINDQVEDEFADIVQLTDALNNSPAAGYADAVAQFADIDQWLRYFAVGALLGDTQGLAAGLSDDAYLYHSSASGLFQLMPHDLDSLLGRGDVAGSATDGIFPAATALALNRFLTDEEILPRYNAVLRDLLDHEFSADEFDALLDRELAGFVPASEIEQMKSFMDTRREHVLSIVAPELSVESTLPIEDGYPMTTAPNTSLSGRADPTNSTSVTVNGSPADYTRLTGQWSHDSVPLNPGINRIIVESYDADGQVTDRRSFDVWYDDGDMLTISGTLTESTTLTAEEGPWYVSSMLTVPPGMVLTIQPGTTVFFDDDAGFQVDGRIVAEGTQYERIRLTRLPSSNDPWQGINIEDSPGENRLTYIDQEYGDDQGESINIDHSQVLIDHMTWFGVETTTLELDNPRLIVSNSHFAGTGDAEVIHGTDLEDGEYFILDGNVFDFSISEDDVIDFTGGQRPGPIFQVLNNVFYGGYDDGIDLDSTDAHVEGNVFTNFHRQGGRDTTSNGIATGDDSLGLTEVTVVRNVFYDNDHHILLKEDAYLTAHNNVFYGASIAAIQFHEPDGSAVDGPGRGADFDGAIFWDNARLFLYEDDLADPDLLTIHRSIVPPADVDRGIGLIAEDPRFVDPSRGDFRLRLGSPALGSGPNGLDMGAMVAPGASVSGEPASITYRTDALLTVSGPGITHYRYRVDDGPYSDELSVDTPIELTGLSDGEHVVELLGKNSADVWQDPAESTFSRAWTVDASYARLWINEVLVRNESAWDHEGTYPGAIELFNESADDVDLSGMSISDDPQAPAKFVFPAGTMIPAGGHLVLWSSEDDGTSGMHVGFTLGRDGGGVYLFDSPAQGSTLIDEVSYGRQIPDASIGRAGPDRHWQLNRPSPGDENVAFPVGEPGDLLINEWFTAGQVRLDREFVELRNLGTAPISLTGVHLHSGGASLTSPERYGPLSFMAGDSYMTWPEAGSPDGSSFDLAHQSGWLELTAGDGEVIDRVHYGPQTIDVSQGRRRHDVESFRYMDIPTPNLANGGDRLVDQRQLIEIDQVWRYDDSGDDLGTEWREPEFDDTAWDFGQALLYYDDDTLDAPQNTELDYDEEKTTYYFRTQFQLNVDPADVTSLLLSPFVDDGAVFYLNGVEVLRVGMPAGVITSSTFANRQIGDADYEGPFSIPVDLLRPGVNFVAGEAHQRNLNSSDVVFGMTLDATTETIEDNTAALRPLASDLRVSELMFAPPEGEQLEYVELRNTGDQALDLSGVRLTGDVDFTFDALSLQPGQYVVVVADPTAFESRYGDQVPVAGRFAGNLSDEVGRVRLQLPDPFEASILDFDYQGAWFPQASGGGASLNIVDPSVSAADWSERVSWSAAGPSPGADIGPSDLVPPTIASVQLNAEPTDPPDLPGRTQPTDWRTQRGDIRSITIAFSEPVDVAPSDLRLTNLGVDAPDDPDSTITLTEDHLSIVGNELVIAFAPFELPDGVYRLEILDSVTDSHGNALDGDGDDVAGGDFVMTGDDANRFYKLTGDWNGDYGVSIFDFDVFVYWFGYSEPQSPEYMDLNLDLGVSIFDFTIFAAHFGSGVRWPTGLTNAVLSVAQSEWSGGGDESEGAAEQPLTDHARAADRLFTWIGASIRPAGERRASNSTESSETETGANLESILAESLVGRQ